MIQAGRCPNCGKGLSPMWRDKCEHCKTPYSAELVLARALLERHEILVAAARLRLHDRGWKVVRSYMTWAELSGPAEAWRKQTTPQVTVISVSPKGIVDYDESGRYTSGNAPPGFEDDRRPVPLSAEPPKDLVVEAVDVFVGEIGVILLQALRAAFGALTRWLGFR